MFSMFSLYGVKNHFSQHQWYHIVICDMYSLSLGPNATWQTLQFSRFCWGAKKNKNCWKQSALLLVENTLHQHCEQARCWKLSALFPILLLSKHWEKKISVTTRTPSRHPVLQQSGLASSWADSICLTFSVGHIEHWVGYKFCCLGLHWSENSESGLLVDS